MSQTPLLLVELVGDTITNYNADFLDIEGNFYSSFGSDRDFLETIEKEICLFK